MNAPNPANNETYTYNPTGNRITAQNTSGNWQYNANNQLEAYGNKALTYDANGNTIGEYDTSTTPSTLLKNYGYDQEDRLKTITDGVNPIANYDYDPLGRRIKKIVGAVTTYYVYTDEGLIAEYDDLGKETQSYGYVPNSSWGTNPLYTNTIDGYAYYHTDHLGTPKIITNSTGAKVWEGFMDGFGKTTVTLASNTNNLRFPGQYYDEESGQHYNYFRNYDPVTGRYGSSDPIGMAGGINAYLYVFQNPNVGADPTGLICGLGHCVAIALIAAKVALAIWNAFTTYEILEDDCISTKEKIKTVALGAVFSPLKRVGRVGARDGVHAAKGLGKVDSNKLDHLFGQEKHKLGPLLDKFGGN